MPLGALEARSQKRTKEVCAPDSLISRAGEYLDVPKATDNIEGDLGAFASFETPRSWWSGTP